MNLSNGLSKKFTITLLLLGTALALTACPKRNDGVYLGSRHAPVGNPNVKEEDIASSLPIHSAIKRPDTPVDANDPLNPTPYDSVGVDAHMSANAIDRAEQAKLKNAPVDEVPASQRRMPVLNQQAQQEVQGGIMSDKTVVVPATEFPALTPLPPTEAATPMDDSIQRRFDALMAKEKSQDEAVKASPPPPPVAVQSAPPAAPEPKQMTALPPADLPPPATPARSAPIATMPERAPEPAPAAPPVVMEPAPASAPEPAAPVTASAPAREPINLVPPPPEVASVPDASPTSASAAEPIILKQPTGQGGVKYRLMRDSRYTSRRVTEHHNGEQ